MSYKTYVSELPFRAPDEAFKAGMCFCSLPDSLQIPEISTLLHPQEVSYFDSLRFKKRKTSYLIGRYAAKQALMALLGEQNNPQTILIQPGIFNQPIVTCPTKQNVQISISHCDDFGAALAFSEAHPMGIDIEKINTERRQVFESQMTKDEINMISRLNYSYDAMLAVLWTAKEALSKILKTGLITPFQVYEINKVEAETDHINCLFENFGQYKGVSLNMGHYICSIVFPKHTEITIEIAHLKKMFS